MGKLTSKDARQDKRKERKDAKTSLIPEASAWQTELKNAQAEQKRIALDNEAKGAASAAERRKKKLATTMLFESQKRELQKKQEAALTSKSAFSDLFSALEELGPMKPRVINDPLSLPAAPARPIAKQPKAKLDRGAIAHFTAVVSARSFQTNPIAALNKQLNEKHGGASDIKTGEARAAAPSAAPSSNSQSGKAQSKRYTKDRRSPASSKR